MTAAEIEAVVDELTAHYWGHDWHSKPDRKLVMDTLHELAQEARKREQRDYSRKVSEMAERICAPDVYRKRGII